PQPLDQYPADPYPARTGRRRHGRDLWSAYRQGRRVHGDTGTGRDQPGHVAAFAQLGGMPILMVTGQKPIRKSKQGRFQTLDVVDVMTPLTKFTHRLASGDNIPAGCARLSGSPKRRSPARRMSSFLRTSPPKTP